MNSNVDNPASVQPVLKSLSRVKDAASGNVPYTGIGFKPSLILFFATLGASIFPGGVGFDNATVRQSVNIRGNGGTLCADVYCIYCDDGGANYQAASVASLDDDGFTLTWTLGGTGAANDLTVNAICFR